MSADPGDWGWAQSRGTAQQQQQQQLALPNRSAPPPDRSTGGVSPGRVRKWLRFPQGAAASLRAPAANRGPDVISGSASPGAAPRPPPLLPLRTPGPHHSRQIWQREEPPLTALQQMAAALKGNPCPGRHTRGHSHVCVLTSAARVHTRVNRVCRRAAMHGHTHVCKQLLVDLGPPCWGVPLSGSLPSPGSQWVRGSHGAREQCMGCGVGTGQGWPQSMAQAWCCRHGMARHSMAQPGSPQPGSLQHGCPWELSVSAAWQETSWDTGTSSHRPVTSLRPGPTDAADNMEGSWDGWGWLGRRCPHTLGRPRTLLCSQPPHCSAPSHLPTPCLPQARPTPGGCARPTPPRMK